VASEQTDEQDLVPIEESELLFRLQMKIADVFFEPWKNGLTILRLASLLVLGVGLYQGKVTKAFQASSASIAAVDRKVPVPDQMAVLGFAPLDDLNDPDRVQLLEAIANKYESIASEATHAPAAEALIKAGDVWQRLESSDKAQSAYAAAIVAFDEGIYGYTAKNALANARLSAGDAAGAAELYREISTTEQGYLGERGHADLSAALEAAGQTQESIDSWRSFGTRYPDSLLADDATAALKRLGSANAATPAGE